MRRRLIFGHKAHKVATKASFSVKKSASNRFLRNNYPRARPVYLIQWSEPLTDLFNHATMRRGHVNTIDRGRLSYIQKGGPKSKVFASMKRTYHGNRELELVMIGVWRIFTSNHSRALITIINSMQKLYIISLPFFFCYLILSSVFNDKFFWERKEKVFEKERKKFFLATILFFFKISM